jgi:hypothetical protein
VDVGRAFMVARVLVGAWHRQAAAGFLAQVDVHWMTARASRRYNEVIMHHE